MLNLVKLNETEMEVSGDQSDYKKKLEVLQEQEELIEDEAEQEEVRSYHHILIELIVSGGFRRKKHSIDKRERTRLKLKREQEPKSLKLRRPTRSERKLKSSFRKLK